MNCNTFQGRARQSGKLGGEILAMCDNWLELHWILQFVGIGERRIWERRCWPVNSGELNFLHRTKLEWFHDIKLLHCLSLIIDSSTKACRTGEAWGERSSLELGDNGHFMVGPGMFAEKCSQGWLAMMWKRIYCDKIYELAHYWYGENIQEVDICMSHWPGCGNQWQST